jgi:hypothetical protein
VQIWEKIQLNALRVIRNLQIRTRLYFVSTLQKVHVTCMSDSRRGFELEIAFIDHFNTRLMTALNCNGLNELHTPTIAVTVANTKSSLSSLDVS